MSENFNPYHKWLGIPHNHQPPNHYRLLGIEDFELAPEDMDALNAVSTLPPCYPTNFLDLFCRKESAFYGGLREYKNL